MQPLLTQVQMDLAVDCLDGDLGATTIDLGVGTVIIGSTINVVING